MLPTNIITLPQKQCGRYPTCITEEVE